MRPARISLEIIRLFKVCPSRVTPRSLFILLIFAGFLISPQGAYSRPLEGLAKETAVPDSVLDSMRGGFSIGNLDFNFSFSSVTWVNNVLITQTDLTLANNIITSLKDVINNPALKNLGLVPVSQGTQESPTTVSSQSASLVSQVLPDNQVVNIPSSSSTTNKPGTNSGGVGNTPINTPGTGSLSGLPSGKSTLSGPTTTLISVGSGNSGVTGNALANSQSLTTVIQNNANNVVIQHLTQLNGIISNMGPVTHTTNMILRFNQASTLGSILSRF